MITQRAVYLDCNATHPLLPAVREGLSREIVSQSHFLLNPSSVHRHGQRSKELVAELRLELGSVVGRADGDEWVFGSGATESINTVLKGFCRDRRSQGRRPVIMTTKAEHSAVLETLAFCEADTVEFVEIFKDGQPSFEELLTKATLFLEDQNCDLLFSFLLVNNETGVLLNYEKLFEVLEALRTRFEKSVDVQGSQKFFSESLTKRLWLHLDAAQAFGKIEPRMLRMAWRQADYASVSAHKLGAVQGIGALWVRPQVPFAPFIHGGVQEKKRRAGTFNSVAAYSWLLALRDWKLHGEAYRTHMSQLRKTMAHELEKITGLYFHGLASDQSLPMAVNTLNFHVEDCDEESLVMALDVEGFSVSSGSACNSGSLKPSHVLMAMGYSSSVALSSVRVSLGVETTLQEVLEFAKCAQSIVKRIRDGKAYWSELLPNMRDNTKSQGDL